MTAWQPIGRVAARHAAAPVFRRLLRLARAAGVDVLVVPGHGPAHGMAYADAESGQIEITLWVDPRHAWAVFVLLHEVAHVILGHVTRPAVCRPAWEAEYAADRLALTMLQEVMPLAVPMMTRLSRRRLRPMIQVMLDAGIIVHGEREAGAWAGCRLPASAEVVG